MNRSKKLYILLGILAAACIVTFAVMQMDERKEQIRETGEIILELPGESVQSLSWEYGETALAFHRDGGWVYDGDESFPVSEERINALLEPFQAFGAAFVIEEVEDFGQYGLDDPLCTIRLSTGTQDYEIQLGGYSQMDAQRYVSIGDGKVYLAKHDPLDEYDAVLRDMIDHDEIPSFDHVTGIQFSGAQSYDITYEENSAFAHSQDDVYFTQHEGKTLPLDTSRVENYLRGITNLNPVDYVSYHVTQEELQSYGLDAPVLTITVEYTAQEEGGGEGKDVFVLHVSPDPEDVKAAQQTQEGDKEAEISAYIRVGESQIVYKISSANYKKVAAASYDDLRHPQVIWADFSDVRQLDVSLEGEHYTFTSQQEGDERAWSYQGKEFEMDGLRNDLTALSAQEFTSQQPAQKEEIRLTVHLDHENISQIEIALYRYDAARCLAVVDGESVSLVDRAAVVELIEAVHAIVLN